MMRAILLLSLVAVAAAFRPRMRRAAPAALPAGSMDADETTHYAEVVVEPTEGEAMDFGDTKPVQLTASFDKSPHQMMREVARIRAEQQKATIEESLGRPVSVAELAELVGEGHNAEFVTNMIFGHTMDKGNHFLDY